LEALLYFISLLITKVNQDVPSSAQRNLIEQIAGTLRKGGSVRFEGVNAKDAQAIKSYALDNGYSVSSSPSQKSQTDGSRGGASNVNPSFYKKSVDDSFEAKDIGAPAIINKRVLENGELIETETESLLTLNLNISKVTERDGFVYDFTKRMGYSLLTEEQFNDGVNKIKILNSSFPPDEKDPRSYTLVVNIRTSSLLIFILPPTQI
jgi:hypothetical protein